MFGPLGLKDYGSATLHCKIWFLPTPSTLAQSKERKGSNFAIWQHWSRSSEELRWTDCGFTLGFSPLSGRKSQRGGDGRARWLLNLIPEEESCPPGKWSRDFNDCRLLDNTAVLGRPFFNAFIYTSCLNLYSATRTPCTIIDRGLFWFSCFHVCLGMRLEKLCAPASCAPQAACAGTSNP